MDKNRVSLELKVPPVAAVILFAVVMAGVAKLLPGLSFEFPGCLGIAISFTLAGVSIILAGILAFRQHEQRSIRLSLKLRQLSSPQGYIASPATRCMWALS